MPSQGDIIHSVNFFQGAFSLILAFALCEALKAFTSDNQDQALHWNRIPSLIAFLFVFFPFFQSMSRYFYSAYLDPQTALAYNPNYLAFDGIVFTLQSGCFFTMGRSLAPHRWQRFYTTVLVLLLLDIGWVIASYVRGFHVISWLYLDLFIAAAILGLMWFECGKPASMRPSYIGLAIVIITTVPSYWLEHDMYFP